MMTTIALSVLITFMSLVTAVIGLGQEPTITFNSTNSTLTLASGGSAVQIFADQSDWPAALRAANDLAFDFGRVSSVNGSLILLNDPDNYNVSAYTAGVHFSSNPHDASMIFNITGTSSFEKVSSAPKGGVIIVGTLGNSSLIDRLISSKKIDVSAIQGTWEAFMSAVVHDPIPGIASALVIAGSDRRGTVYGIYDVSEQIGVSPWYYWADSAPLEHRELYAIDTIKVQSSPSVRYRGFFINDEAPAITGYVNEKFGTVVGSNYTGPGFVAPFYSSVFELLLRLRANYLWPAQWNSMFNVDDSRTQALADEYGIVMGTSHTEPMMRSTKEWSVFGNGTYNGANVQLQGSWSTNNASIYPFFVEGAERQRPYEGVITMGMRGSGDTALSAGIETELLENVVATQREILANVFGNQSVTNPDIVPQMWCLYKEVQGYYEAGMTVPDDITLLWTDDNFGNIRRLPLSTETNRTGGAGVYYHFDYVGDPRDYKWINTVLLQRTWEQMHLAYERDAKQIWVVNVGDLKPLELPISHFLDLAYDFDLWDKDSVPDWLELWAGREFGHSVATQTAVLMNNYSLAAGRRKFELVDPSTYSLINYNEADIILAEWEEMADAAQAIMNSLPASAQAAFFEMCYHPVQAGYIYHSIMISAAKNNLHAEQGRSSTNALAQYVRSEFAYDHHLSQSYNELLGGKWNHMMDQTHIGYVYWQQPMRQALPPLQYIQEAEGGLAGNLGVTVEGSNATIPGDDMYHTLSSEVLTLPPIDPYGPPARWIDIFSRGISPFIWSITAAPYLNFTQTQGNISSNGTDDIRIWVSVDWSQLTPSTTTTTTINISSSTDYGTQYSMPQVILPLNYTVIPSNFSAGFIESDSHIAIEAEHYTRIINPTTPANTTNSSSINLTYETIPNLSRTLSGLTLFPITAPSLTTSSAPALEYDMYTFTPLATSNLTLDPNTGTTTPVTPNTVNITLHLGPSLNTIPSRPLRYAVQLDDQEIQETQYIIDQPAGANPTGWLTAVADAVWKSTSTFNYTGPGAHSLKVWELEPGVVLQKIVLDLGGVRESYLGPPESYRI